MGGKERKDRKVGGPGTDGSKPLSVHGLDAYLDVCVRGIDVKMDGRGDKISLYSSSVASQMAPSNSHMPEKNLSAKISLD